MMSVFLITLAFIVPLKELFFFSINSNLYSHIVLIPIASIVLAFINADAKRNDLRIPKWMGIIPLSIGAYFSFDFLTGNYTTDAVVIEDYLFSSTIAYVFLIIASAHFFFSKESFSTNVFYVYFLVFMIPMSVSAREFVEIQLQHSSADAAELFFSLSSTPLLREDLIFNLPGLALEVAPQCSGIHSSLVLFITSVAATKLFLESWWKRAILIGFIYPLAALRNGFRVFVLGELAVRINPDILHSWLHRKGGPIFFALSMIPFFLLLYALYRSEEKKKKRLESQ